MNYSFLDIKSFIEKKVGCDEDEITESIDIEEDLGCWGDDFHELIDEYSKTFHVDMTTYRWYFHTGEEGNSLGGLVIKAPYERVNRIPITPTILLDSANAGKWLISYPEHKLPKNRYDIWINQILVLAFIVFCIYKCSK